MSLIQCPECGKQVSDRANSCPNCGCPLEKKADRWAESDQNESKKTSKNIGKWLFYALLLAIFAAAIAVLLAPQKQAATDQPAAVEDTVSVETETESDAVTDEESENLAVEEAAEDGEPIYSIVEEQPEYPGGFTALIQYLGQNVKYPTDAKGSGMAGRAIVKFVIEKDGSISHAEVVRSLSPEFDKEALRVVRSMPKWSPGKQDGKAVRVYYHVPVNFKAE